MVKNVLLLTIDSLRADYFLPSPDAQISTPVFSSLAREGISFKNAFATGPGTTCSFPALLTGTLPLSYDGLGPLSTDRPKIAEELLDSGLATAGFQTNPFLSKHFNYDAGFGSFEDYQNPLMGIATEIFPRGIEINNSKLRKLDEALNITELFQKTYQMISGKVRPYVSADIITEDIIGWLEDIDRPFFCWGHYMDVHHPCFPPEDIRRQFGLEDITASQVSDWYSRVLDAPDELTEHERNQFRQLYVAAIVYVDQQIGRIVNHLHATERWDETMVVVTSDHGELFGEYGAYGKPVRMYHELLRVPLVIVNGPSYIEEAANDMMSLLDVPPLVHDAIGAAIPSVYEGRVPDVESQPHREYIIAEHQIEGDIVIGARSSDQLYEYNGPRKVQGFFRVGPETFAPIAADSGDEALKTEVIDRLERVDVTVDMPELDDDVEDRLDDLGYL